MKWATSLLSVLIAIGFVLFAAGSSWSTPIKVVVSVACVVVLVGSALIVVLTPDLPPSSSAQSRHQGSRGPREQQDDYYRRRAEDARMRDLMNPGDKKAPPTDWYGR